MKIWIHGRAWIGGVVIAAVAVVGCVAPTPTPSDPAGGDGSLPLPPTVTPTVAAASSGPAGELPLDWFVRLQDEIGRREGDLYFGYMERCMAEAGFTWEAPQSPPGSAEWEEIVRYPIRYGMVTLVQAERAAYADPEEVFLGASTEEADNEGLPSDPAEFEAFQKAWFGATEEAPPEEWVAITDPVTGEPILSFDPSSPRGGGCLGRADVWLEGEALKVDDIDVTTDVDFARIWIDIRIRAAFDEALADDRVVTVAIEWRGCMTERGWELEEWAFPGGLGLGRPGPISGSDEEIATELERLDEEARNTERAVDDVRCQDEVEWLESLRAVEAEYQQETVERVPDLFAEVRDLVGAYSARLATLRLEDLDG
ncbi:MAG: hypothetical protein ACC683_04980 [Acidimicrobiia bacterium]